MLNSGGCTLAYLAVTLYAAICRALAVAQHRVTSRRIAVRWRACTLPVAVLWQSCHVTINCTLAGLYAVCWCVPGIMFLYAASCYSSSRVATQYAVGLYAVRWHTLVVVSLCTAGCCTLVITLL